MQIHCLMFSGCALTDPIRSGLFGIAKGMVEKREGSVKVTTDDFEGVVRTDFRTVGFGDVYGIQFSAEIDSTVGSTKVSFIVRTQDLANIDPFDCFWLTVQRWMVPPSPEKAVLN